MVESTHPSDEDLSGNSHGFLSLNYLLAALGQLSSLQVPRRTREVLTTDIIGSLPNLIQEPNRRHVMQRLTNSYATVVPRAAPTTFMQLLSLVRDKIFIGKAMQPAAWLHTLNLLQPTKHRVLCYINPVPRGSGLLTPGLEEDLFCMISEHSSYIQ